MRTLYYCQVEDIVVQKVVDDINSQRPERIVLLCETEWHSRELTEELAYACNKNRVHVVLLVGSYPHEYYDELTKQFNSIEVQHWYTHWFNWALMCSSNLDFNQSYTSFKYPFICLNNKNWVHRCALVDAISNAGLLSKGILSWHKFPDSHLPSLYDFKTFDDKIKLIGDQFETILDSFLITPEYHESFLHVIGEATTTVPFITEKTCLPILFKKPFIVMADPGFHKKLTDLGFELYDEIIDYSFDDEPDMDTRAKAIARNINNIRRQNLVELYDLIKDKAQRNYDNYMRIVSSSEYLPEIIKERLNLLKYKDKEFTTDGRYKTIADNCNFEYDEDIFDLTIWDNSILDKVAFFKENHSKYTTLILNAALEFEYDIMAGSREYIVDLINFTQENNIKFHIITGSHHSRILLPEYSHLTIHYWPTFWLTLLFTRLLVSPNYQMNNSIGMDVEKINAGKELPIKYPFITMNKVPKIHRAIMMDMLAKYNMIDKGIVIWREETTGYQFKYWEQEILLRDQKEKFVTQETLPLEYATSFIQLVPETGDTWFGLSEKTGMALFFNKPFLVAGSKGFHKILTELGFKLYDELFDYSFDDIEDTEERYDLIAQNINKYVDKTPQELKALYDSVFEKCVYNKKIALRLATNAGIVPEIWQKLVKHQAQNNITDYPEAINNFIKSRDNEYRL